MNSVTKTVLAIAAAATAIGGLATPAFAQRDPAYAAARSAGQVGERMDGYLGIVVAETPALRRIVNDINIKRRAVYSERAKATNATIEEYAFTAGCQAILATVSG
ncbi:MAG: YdbL family protein, partial [Pseudomonadota bacterium]|nr:YdbL family protein [Pseudomonadota bacterium]